MAIHESHFFWYIANTSNQDGALYQQQFLLWLVFSQMACNKTLARSCIPS